MIDAQPQNGLTRRDRYPARVLVVETPMVLNDEQIEKLKVRISAATGCDRVLILDGGASARIMMVD